MARGYWNLCEREGIDVLEHKIEIAGGGGETWFRLSGIRRRCLLLEVPQQTRYALGMGVLEGRSCGFHVDTYPSLRGYASQISSDVRLLRLVCQARNLVKKWIGEAELRPSHKRHRPIDKMAARDEGMYVFVVRQRRAGAEMLAESRRPICVTAARHRACDMYGIWRARCRPSSCSSSSDALYTSTFTWDVCDRVYTWSRGCTGVSAILYFAPGV